MTEMKKCPFCGGEAEFKIFRVRVEDGTVVVAFEIGCKKCGATAPNAYGRIKAKPSLKYGSLNIFDDDSTKAIEAWNRRADT